MPQRDRLYRVVHLCHKFAQALAYYRVQFSPQFRWLFDPTKTDCSGVKFWRAVNGALFDSCVLEWCKLFGSPKEHHHWRNVVTDRARFKAELLNHLKLTEAGFQHEIEVMLEYRDKWAAHQDSETKGTYPAFYTAKKAVWFYHAYIVNHEAQPNDLDVAADLEPEYLATENDAKVVLTRFYTQKP